MRKSFFFIILSVLIMASCGTAPVKYNVKRPAQINLKGLKQVALGNFKGKNPGHVNILMNKVAQDLIDSKYFDSVLDRKNMDEILKEHKLVLSGVVDNDILELGSFIGAAALIFAEIETDKYNESMSQKEVVLTNRHKTTEKDKYGRVIYTNSYADKVKISRTGTYSLTITFQMVDVQTARLITVKTFSVNKKFEKFAYNETPEKLDRESLYYSLASGMSRDFVRQLVPSYVQIKAKFLKDRDLPQVDLAILNIQAGSTEEAIEIFRKMTEFPGLKPKVQAKTWYNLGLAQGFNQQFEEAIENVNKALFLNPKEKLYLNALRMIRNEQKQAEILKSQE